MTKLEEAKKLLAKATPVPYEFHIADGTIRGVLGHIATMRPTCVTDLWEADAHLLTHAPTLLAWAVGEIERMEKVVGAARRVVSGEPDWSGDAIPELAIALDAYRAGQEKP